MANGLSTFINMLGQKPQPGFAAGMMKGQDEALARRKLEEEMARAEALAPYELLKAKREAIMGPQAQPTSQARQTRELVEMGMDPAAARDVSYGRFKTMYDPNTGGTFLFDTFNNKIVDSNTARGVELVHGQAGVPIQEATPEEQEQLQIGGGTTTTEEPITEPAGVQPLIPGTKEEEREKASKERIEDKVIDISKRAEDARIPQLKTQIDRIESNWENALPGATKPGTGLFDRIISMKAAPLQRFMGTPEGQQAIQDLQMLYNEVYKAYAGSAVSGSEEERQKLALGADAFATPEGIQRGVENIKRMTQAMEDNIYAGYPPEAVEQYKNNLEAQIQRRRETREDDTKGQQEQGQTQATARPQDPNTAWSAIRQAYPDVPEDELLEAAKEAGDLPPDYSPPAPTGNRGQRGGAVATNQTPVRPPAQPNTERSSTRSEATQATPSTPTPEQDTTQETVSLLRGELDRGVPKKAIKEHLDSMKADGTITQREYVQIMRELQLGTYDVQAQRSSRERRQRGGGTR